MTTLHGRDYNAQTSGRSSSTNGQDIELRGRQSRNRSGHSDAETPSLTPEPTPEERHLRHIAQGCMCLDLKAAQTVMEGFTREEKIRNIKPHFEYLWKCRAPTELIESWIESEELYHSQIFMNLPSFQQYVKSLSYDQLLALVDTREASPFYVRMLVGRIWKLQEQKTINGLASRDLKGCFDINLGLLISERAASENDYLTQLTQKQFMARVRLARVLDDARLLRNSITSAFDEDALNKDLLPSLRSRIRALQEHYEEAGKLLEEKGSETLLEHTSEAWLEPRQAPTHNDRRRQPTVTLACLTLLFCLIAGYPVSMGFASTPNVPGLWSDANFWGLLGAAILQLLNLMAQLLGPFVIPDLAHARLRVNTEPLVWAWIIGFLAFLLTGASVAAYGSLSVRLSAWLAFASQVTMGMLQLMLIFRT